MRQQCFTSTERFDPVLCVMVDIEEGLPPYRGADPDAYDFDDDEWQFDGCGNCGGEGYVYDCIDGCCVNAEDGCDLCAMRCDWCNPRKPAPQPAEGEGR